MNIGVDIDGVLTDFENFKKDVCGKYCFEKGLTIKNPNGYTTQEIFEMSDEMEGEFWHDAILLYIKEPARRYASEVLKLLHQQGHQIFIITNRSSGVSYSEITPQQMQAIVVDWLAQNDIFYDQIIFSTNYKKDEILANNIDIMIEDKSSNVQALAQVTNVICFDAGHNKDVNGKNIFRCYSWYDILSTINALQNQSK